MIVIFSGSVSFSKSVSATLANAASFGAKMVCASILSNISVNLSSVIAFINCLKFPFFASTWIKSSDVGSDVVGSGGGAAVVVVVGCGGGSTVGGGEFVHVFCWF